MVLGLGIGLGATKVIDSGPGISLSAASVPENSPTGTVIGTVTPTNASNPGAVSIASQTPANSFQMNVDGVTVEVGSAGLNYETTPTISVTFEYTDDDGTYQFVRTIYVTDVADGPTTAGATTDLDTELGTPTVGALTTFDARDVFGAHPLGQTMTFTVSHGSVDMDGFTVNWTPVATDVSAGSLTFTVTAEDEDGQTLAVDSSPFVVGVSITPPAFSVTDLTEGDSVTVTSGAALGATSSATYLLLDGVDVTGDIVAGSYTVPAITVDATLTLIFYAYYDGVEFIESVTATIYAIPAEIVTTIQFDIVASDPPVNTVAPALSGTEEVGQTLTSTAGTWTGTAPITYGYQWQRSDDGSTGWTNISGATSSNYTLQAGDATKYVRCEITGTNAVAFDVAHSDVSGQIAAASGIQVPVLLGTFAGTANATDFETTAFDTTDTSIIVIDVTTTNNDSTSVVMGYTDITLGASGRGFGTGTSISTTPHRSSFTSRVNVQSFLHLTPAAATSQTVQIRLANTSRDTVIRVWKVEGANRTTQTGATAANSLNGNQTSSPVSVTTNTANSLVMFFGIRNYDAGAITISTATEIDQRTSGGTTAATDHNAWAAYTLAGATGAYACTASWTGSLAQAAVGIELLAA